MNERIQNFLNQPMQLNAAIAASPNSKAITFFIDDSAFIVEELEEGMNYYRIKQGLLIVEEYVDNYTEIDDYLSNNSPTIVYTTDVVWFAL